jgi:hypothetical protein
MTGGGLVSDTGSDVSYRGPRALRRVLVESRGSPLSCYRLSRDVTPPCFEEETVPVS